MKKLLILLLTLQTIHAFASEIDEDFVKDLALTNLQ